MRITKKPTQRDNPFLELLPNPVVEVDASYAITYLNPAARLHLPDLEKLGRDHPLLAGLSTMVEELSKDEPQMVVFVREITHAGKTYEQQLFTVPEKKRIYLYMADVTERKQALTGLQQGEEQLRAANRRLGELLAAKDKFVANVSHELRTPLTAIKEGVSLLKDGVLGSLSSQQTDFLRTVAKNADRLMLLIEHILDMAKIGAGRLWLSRRRLKLLPLIEANLEQLKSIAGRRRLRCECEEIAAPDVFADDQKIGQVLTNLISNAVKFTHEEGSITCRLQGREGSVAVTIQDDGVGITLGDLTKLFERFSQVGEYKTGGTGLGLVLCKELVELHRGTISAASELGKGSAFTFTLPVYTPEFALEESFRQLLETAKPAFLHAPTIGLIVIDCEAVGIEHLEQIAQRLRKYVKNGDLVLAMEPPWVVILAATEIKGVQSICQRLQGSLGEWGTAPEERRGPFLINFGWAVYPVDGGDAKTLFAEATSFIQLRAAYLEKISGEAPLRGTSLDRSVEEATLAPIVPRKRRILVADDDPVLLQMMTLRLETLGFEVQVAFDGEEVLEQVKGKEPIDLILVDLKMPKLDGFEVCRQLKTLGKQIPVIASTAYWEALQDKCRDLGFTDVLKKPFATRELIEHVTQALEGKR